MGGIALKNATSYIDSQALSTSIIWKLECDSKGGGNSMLRSLKLAVPVLLVGLGAMFTANVSYGKAEYTKKEKKSCVTCHTAANSKELNDVGKCYGKSKTLEGCVKK
jgi:mono/diheme cytochrome c family protein